MTPGRWALSFGVGVVATAAVFTGTWPYLLLVVPGIVFAVVAVAFPRAALLLWVLLAPMATAYGTVELPGGIPDITFRRATLLLVTVATLLRSRVQGRRFAPLEAPELAMLALVAILGLDFMARAQDRSSEALQHFDETIGPCILFVLARSLFGRAGDGRRVAWAVVIATCLLGLHGTYQVIRGPGSGITEAQVSLKEVEGGERVNESHYEAGRGVGPFVSAVEFGGAVAIGLGAALYLAFHAVSGPLRFLSAAMMVPIGLGVVASLTRSVWVGAFAALLATLVFDRSARRVIAPTLTLVTIVLALVFFGSARAAALRDRAESVEPVTGRLIMVRLAGQLVLERPLTGYGSGLPTRLAALAKLRESADPDAYLAPGQFHNLFLMTLVEWGVGGLIVRLLVFAALLKGAMVLRARGPGEASDAYYFGGMFLFASVVYLIQCLAVDMPAYLYLNGLYFFLAGVVWAQIDALPSPAPRAVPISTIARA